MTANDGGVSQVVIDRFELFLKAIKEVGFPVVACSAVVFMANSYISRQLIMQEAMATHAASEQTILSNQHGRLLDSVVANNTTIADTQREIKVILADHFSALKNGPVVVIPDKINIPKAN